MAFSSNSSGGAMSDINVTPLVDVMLVLLIIFMVTMPAASYQIQVDLPQPSKNLEQPKDPPKPIRLRIDANGQLFWDGSPLPAAALEPQLVMEAARDVQPTLELETSPEARYEALADVLSTAKNAGMEKIGFVETLQ